MVDVEQAILISVQGHTVWQMLYRLYQLVRIHGAHPHRLTSMSWYL